MVLLKQRMGASSITCGCDPHKIWCEQYSLLKSENSHIVTRQNPKTNDTFFTAEVIGIVYSI